MDPKSLSREQLYQGWLAWVNSNLRDDPEYAGIAANAAADAAMNGDGFNAAVTAATNAFIEAAQGDKPLWRPGFGSLLLTDRYFWGLLVLLITMPLYWVAPALSLLAVLIPFAVIAVVWKVYVFSRLARCGVVMPGSLVKLTVKDSDGDVYRATYEFNFHGQHLISRRSGESTPAFVLVLFDPKHPKFAMVLPDLLTQSR